VIFGFVHRCQFAYLSVNCISRFAGNQFSTLGGIPFSWSVPVAVRNMENVTNPATVLRMVRFVNSTYTASDKVFALEAQVCMC
jgi:hypothetical protein